MVQKIQCYKDASGKLHEQPFDAYRADLALWFARSESINDTSAKQLADRIAGDSGELDELIETLKAVRDNAPERPTAIAPAPLDDRGDS